jgi:hypothetical protein
MLAQETFRCMMLYPPLEVDIDGPPTPEDFFFYFMIFSTKFVAQITDNFSNLRILRMSTYVGLLTL